MCMCLILLGPWWQQKLKKRNPTPYAHCRAGWHHTHQHPTERQVPSVEAKGRSATCRTRSSLPCLGTSPQYLLQSCAWSSRGVGEHTLSETLHSWISASRIKSLQSSPRREAAPRALPPLAPVSCTTCSINPNMQSQLDTSARWCAVCANGAAAPSIATWKCSSNPPGWLNQQSVFGEGLILSSSPHGKNAVRKVLWGGC